MATESRSTISAVCWVPRGKAALNPTSYVLASQELSELRSLKDTLLKSRKQGNSRASSDKERGRAPPPDREEAEAEWEDDDGESSADDEAECQGGEREAEQDVDMDDDEEEEGSQFFGVLKEDGAATLNDPYLQMGEEDSDEEEANIILPTDLILVAATAEHDFSSLEVYVYDEDRGSFYVHHDILTGGFPLCLEWLSTSPATGGQANLVASGSFDPEISIWNLDVLDRVDAVCTLGKKKETALKRGRGDKKKRRQKQTQSGEAQGSAASTHSTESNDSHEGPVMCLHVSPIKSQILASGSADETVRLWDLTSGACLHTYRHHQNKVQALRWHPVEEAVLLSASYDRRAALVDVRKPDSVMYAPLKADAEACCWDRHRPMNFWASAEDGSICCIDVRKLSNSSASSKDSKAANAALVWSLRAHKGAASGLADSSIKDLMVTSGIDGVAKLWHVTGAASGVAEAEVSATCGSAANKPGAPSLVFERDLKGGPLYCCQSNEDLPNVLGFGGNCVVLWDITDTDVVKSAFHLKG
ncbi:WD domain, G-beta repeat-containing protein [Toxoplasma gondii MAS]|uniref:WD domain, G-beta repeat-containing protein n=2 Tax=Toxoplasma gondii TaxID=5811 RepID=A0A086Q488_TOXGO|nr:WD domain, G-beta repeat-containing protein [Toxoplasma gondii MAS]PUA90173.1 WD domain, G-beta repeat-containing protein [Toxoplasma gondii TgCATBr9]